MFYLSILLIKIGEKGYIRDSFHLIMEKLTKNGLSLPNICCDDHRQDTVPFLLYEYITIRYHLEAKRFKNEVIQKQKEEQHKLRKLSKLVA